MKIKYKKSKLLFELLPGLFWTTIGIINLIEMEHIRWFKFGYIIIGMAYFGTFIFNASQQYLTIENETIQINSIVSFRNKINLKDIIEIKMFEGYYNLLTETTHLKIRIILIAEDSLEDLKHILSKLDLPSDKTPFPKENNEIQLPQL